MIKGYDNFFTSNFKDISEGFTVNEDIPGENILNTNFNNNQIINNNNNIPKLINNNKKSNNSKNSSTRNNIKLGINKDLSTTLKKMKNEITHNEQPDEQSITAYQELITKQEENNLINIDKLAENNKKRNQLNKQLNNTEINSKNNKTNSQDKYDNNESVDEDKVGEDKVDEDIMEEDIEQEDIEQEDIEQEDIEGFVNTKEGFNGSVIIDNSNNRLLLLTILITFLAYLFCHQITKTFIKSNIKSLDKLLKTDGILQDNNTLINMLLFGVVVFTLLKLL